MYNLTTKVCTGCSKEKPLEDFSLHKKAKFGRNPKCKECKNKAASEFFSANRDKLITRQRNYQRASYYRKTYGISKDDYLLLYATQNGNCGICGKHEEVLCVDHCHSTQRIRGLLCHACNFGLGHFKDKVDLLVKACDYLNNKNSIIGE